jgi:hypothetical protein
MTRSTTRLAVSGHGGNQYLARHASKSRVQAILPTDTVAYDLVGQYGIAINATAT